MELITRRIERICQELKQLSKVQETQINDWKFKEGNYIHPADAQADAQEWKDFDCNTMHWYGKDRHYWFKTTFTVPDSFDNKPLWLRVYTQIDEWDDAKNPQFLLFLDGVPIQGIDMNHREVRLEEHAQAGKTYTLELQSYTGIIHSEFNLFVKAVEIDPRINQLYWDLKVPVQAFTRMEKDNKVRIDIETVLNNTINLLDLRNPHSEEFYASVDKAEQYIQKALYEDMAGYDDIIATCIGHTHIDVAWWWTVEQTREKTGRSFATVLKLMDEYPNYKFMSSQPQLYYFLKERYPELYERVKEKIKEGRWEPEGGMWVEADCNLTCGESLVRQFMHGKKFFKDEFGVDNRILWLPDVFGYSGALPQIMKKCGIDYFMTTKEAWNQFNKIPYDTMKWRGIDGTEILAHFITTLGVGQPLTEHFTTYNGMLHPDAIMGGWGRYQNKDINNDILISYGYGDGGGGPTREMLETSIRMEKGVKGIPKVRQEFARKYFEELDERVSGNRRLPTWEGEFYFEYHRGTYTSMARNKRSNRKTEFMLMNLEFLAMLAEKNGVAYPAEELDQMWKLLLINQFHDILPGSSIHEVYEVTKKEYAELKEQGEKLIGERLSALTGSSDNLTLYNTLGFDRCDVVELEDRGVSAWKDAEGNVYPVQKTADGRAVAYVCHMPSKGRKVLTPASAEAACPFTRDGNHLETPFYSIDLDDQGLFTSLFDKENQRQVLQDGKKGNQLRVYEDKPLDYDNWDIEIYYTEKSWDVTDVTRMEWTEMGPVRATLEIDRKFSNSVIKQKIHFYANTRRIDFESYADWKEHQCLLKTHFPIAIHTDEASFDIQFGNVTRKTHSNTSWDMARFESCGQKWADISEGNYGFSILNDCKYGHSVKDACIALTLIKSGTVPNPVTDQEEHFFTYSAYPHAGNWKQGGTMQEALKLNVPAIEYKGGKEGDDFSFASVDQKNVVLEAVKKAEDGNGVILRLYECENSHTPVTLTLCGDVASAEECDLLENKCGDVKTEGGKVSFCIKPYEIKTIRVTLK